jgi:prepilin-type N-terminal cleavage/methylation domain-containing protein
MRIFGSFFHSVRHDRSGFTLAELLVSIAILVLIATSVAGDVNRTKYQEELTASARVLIGTLRDLQSQALTARSVNTCLDVADTPLVCEVQNTGCVGSCSDPMPPYAVGMVLTQNATVMERFAEVEILRNNRRQDGSMEELGVRRFLQANAGAGTVSVSSLVTENSGSVTTATVTFERQNGLMRVNACDTPQNAPPCNGIPEPKTLSIVLRHARTDATKTVRLNTTTGKISLD